MPATGQGDGMANSSTAVPATNNGIVSSDNDSSATITAAEELSAPSALGVLTSAPSCVTGSTSVTGSAIKADDANGSNGVATDPLADNVIPPVIISLAPRAPIAKVVTSSTEAAADSRSSQHVAKKQRNSLTGETVKTEHDPHAGEAVTQELPRIPLFETIVSSGPQPIECLKPTAPEPPAPIFDPTEDVPLLKKVLRELHLKTWNWDSGECKVFLLPVDERIAPDYYKVIKAPIDLGVITSRIEGDVYKDAWDYMHDMWTMFDNCFAFNRPGSSYHRYAAKFSKWWVPKMEHAMMVEMAGQYCCGRRKTLSGLSFRCRGGTCFVKYGNQFWCYELCEDENIIFCMTHYQKLPKEIVIPRYGNGTGGDIAFPKASLVRRKNNAPLVSELFVTCLRCKRREHEQCVLHNAFNGKPYQCEKCTVETSGLLPPLPQASALPRCVLGDFLEQEVASAVTLQEPVVVRVVNISREVGEAKTRLVQRYPECVKEFPYTRKCVLAFLNVEGCPVCFFGLIVHEYGEDAPQPNHKRAYISLLDSVKLPKELLASQDRTAIYHAIVRGYLRNAGLRGFKYAHIYACPPRKGQNYIFPFKPPEQKEISVSRLRQWYSNMLNKSLKDTNPAIHSFCYLADAFKKPSFLTIPYFDGDNWPDILEDIIKIDEKEKKDLVAKEELRKKVEEAHQEAWKAVPEKERQCRKPRAGDTYYEGVTPPKAPNKKRVRKRRKSIQKPKPMLTLDERLALVLNSSKRDFLVVQLLGNGGEFVPDPDKDAKVANTGEDHSVARYLCKSLLIHHLSANRVSGRAAFLARRNWKRVVCGEQSSARCYCCTGCKQKTKNPCPSGGLKEEMPMFERQPVCFGSPSPSWTNESYSASSVVKLNYDDEESS